MKILLFFLSVLILISPSVYAVDTTPPTILSYYQWDAFNQTIDINYSTDESFSVNWNVTDVSGINVSNCTIYYRNYDNSTQSPLFNYIDGFQDINQNANGYYNVSCLNISINSTSERLYYNLTNKNKWLQYSSAIDINDMVTDGTSAIYGNKIIMAKYVNHTTGANKTIKYNLQIQNSSQTVSPFLVSLCNKYADRNAWRTDSRCEEVGAYSSSTVVHDSLGYIYGITTTNGSGYIGTMLVTDIMYVIGSCPDCSNPNNDWDASYTNINKDYSFTSSTDGAVWTEVGWEFNTYINFFNVIKFETNLTVSDNAENSINNYQFDYYGEIPNTAPSLALQTDNISGNLVSFYDIHGITETGTIWINVSVADNEGNDINCTFYLLNNDTSINSTLLSDFELGSDFGTCYFEWDTLSIPDGDYRFKFSATDGDDTTNETSAGFIRLNSTIPVFVITKPQNITYSNFSIPLEVINLGRPINEWYYSVDYSDWVLFTPNTTLIGFEYNGLYILDVLAIGESGLNSTETVYFSINYTGASYSQNLTCTSSDTHYISINPLDDDDLRWSCTLDTDESYYCVTHVYGNDEFNQKDEQKLIQTNPKRIIIKRYGIVDYFKSTGSYTNVYFTDERLMAESNYTYEVECISTSGEDYGYFTKPVNIEYRQIANSMALGVYGIENAGYILGAFLIVFIVLFIFFRGVKRG